MRPREWLKFLRTAQNVVRKAGTSTDKGRSTDARENKHFSQPKARSHTPDAPKPQCDVRQKYSRINSSPRRCSRNRRAVRSVTRKSRFHIVLIGLTKTQLEQQIDHVTYCFNLKQLVSRPLLAHIRTGNSRPGQRFTMPTSVPGSAKHDPARKRPCGHLGTDSAAAFQPRPARHKAAVTWRWHRQR